MLKFSLFALVGAWVWLASELIRTLNTARICLCDDILIFNFDATCTVSSNFLATKCSLAQEVGSLAAASFDKLGQWPIMA